MITSELTPECAPISLRMCARVKTLHLLIIYQSSIGTSVCEHALGALGVCNERKSIVGKLKERFFLFVIEKANGIS